MTPLSLNADIELKKEACNQQTKTKERRIIPESMGEGGGWT